MLRQKMRWLYFSELLIDEAEQSRFDGKQVLQAEIDSILAIQDESDREEKAKAWMLHMEKLPLPGDTFRAEPQSYLEIEAVLPTAAWNTYPISWTRLPELLQRAWEGRVSGCLLGIPVEGWPSERIAMFLKASDQDPRTGYLKGKLSLDLRRQFDIEDEDSATPYDRQLPCWIDFMTHFPVDDDTNYTVAALRLLERFGRGFTADQVAENLLYSVPVLHVCTAERLAYRNLLNCLLPPDSAWYLNPYREWIGAQIRADFFGYINPGDPKEAARMAYTDASVTHVRNGVYAEMFIAALVSLAPCDLDPDDMIEIAKQQIPPASKLALALDDLLTKIRAGLGYPVILQQLHAQYNEQIWFWWGHAIPNALLVSLVLAYFGCDHSEAIAQAVMAGYDTDCNAATVGSITGFKTGRVGKHWLSVFEPLLQTSIHGYELMALDELARRTYAIALQVQNQKKEK